MPDYPVDPIPPAADTPRTEKAYGENIPYRGIVDHGVPGTLVDPDDEAHYFDNARPVEYVEPPEDKQPDPIPVRVVQGNTRRRRLSARIVTFPIISGQIIQVVGIDLRRTRVKIWNAVQNQRPIYIGTNPNVTAFAGGNPGYALTANDIALDSNTQDPLWVLSQGAASPTVPDFVTVLVEFYEEME